MIVLGWLCPSSDDLQSQERQFPGAFQDMLYKETGDDIGAADEESEREHLNLHGDDELEQRMSLVEDVSDFQSRLSSAAKFFSMKHMSPTWIC